MMKTRCRTGSARGAGRAIPDSFRQIGFIAAEYAVVDQILGRAVKEFLGVAYCFALHAGASEYGHHAKVASHGAGGDFPDVGLVQQPVEDGVPGFLPYAAAPDGTMADHDADIDGLMVWLEVEAHGADKCFGRAVADFEQHVVGVAKAVEVLSATFQAVPDELLVTVSDHFRIVEPVGIRCRDVVLGQGLQDNRLAPEFGEAAFRCGAVVIFVHGAGGCRGCPILF